MSVAELQGQVSPWEERHYEHRAAERGRALVVSEQIADKFEQSVALTGIAPPDDVLEIGCGSGSFLQWATDAGYNVRGVELTSALVDEAQKAGFDVSLARVTELGEQDRFGLVASFHVFEHMTQPELVASFDAVARLLRPGGRLLLEVPNAGSPFGNHIVFGSPTHVSALTAHSLLEWGRLAGLEPIYGGNSPRPLRGGRRSVFAKRAVGLLRDGIERLYAVAYNNGNRLPLDPTVTVVLGKPK